MSNDSERRLRAELRRRTAVIHRATIGGIQPDPVPVSGPEAVWLVEQLTREGWAAAGRSLPTYSRERIPVSFVRRPAK